MSSSDGDRRSIPKRWPSLRTSNCCCSSLTWWRFHWPNYLLLLLFERQHSSRGLELFRSPYPSRNLALGQDSRSADADPRRSVWAQVVRTHSRQSKQARFPFSASSAPLWSHTNLLSWNADYRPACFWSGWSDPSGSSSSTQLSLQRQRGMNGNSLPCCNVTKRYIKVHNNEVLRIHSLKG